MIVFFYAFDAANVMHKSIKYAEKTRQGAYKFGKMKFPEFSRFSRPSNQSFPDNQSENPM